MIMRKLAILAAIAVSSTAGAASARAWFPHRTGECGWVHGRYLITNGAGVRRIWVIGTSHVINIPDSDTQISRSLLAYENHFKDLYAVSRGNGFDPSLYGDFKVCASEAYIRGHMQSVRIRQARRLILNRTPYFGESWWKR